MDIFAEWIRYGYMIVPNFEKQMLSEFGIESHELKSWMKNKELPDSMDVRIALIDAVKRMAKEK